MADDHLNDLHILNGDCAEGLWKQCEFNGQSLVWREIYLEGPLPETEDPACFRTARAEYLSHFAELAGIGISRLCQYLQKLDDSILNLPDSSDLMLWFDSCIFDQTLLMRILYLFNRKKTGKGKVFLYCCDGYCLTINDFKHGWSKKVQLLPHDLEIAEKAWLCFQRKDAEGMMQLAEKENFERMPKMRKALFRCIDEAQPDRNGLTRTQRQIVQLVAEGHHSFMEIFKGLDAFEEYPFLGDTACQRQLETLIRKGLLVRCDEGYALRQTNHLF